MLFLLFCLLQDRVSADPDDPEMQSLQQQLQLLGPVPRRVPLSHQQEMELWNWAEEEVAAGRVSVSTNNLVHTVAVGDSFFRFLWAWGLMASMPWLE
jgi:hypothetical protein